LQAQSLKIDWEGFRRIALVDLGLKPWEFDRLTLAELRLMQEAQRKREERETELAAWIISWVTGPHLKKPISVDRILGRKATTGKSKADQKKEMDWLKERFKKQLAKAN